ncbi:hypothetical protein D3OALGA1CA_1265 [Olavius algarvensis associated proteobacterium Delta 3]|nr:hypothetical protein D3OALGA1CA_1265 [Olavius algarvensis associated proteobacterium Delta 3]CAB5102508.1 hypothetical protein D3OALGB2SA_1923 [Olavius algarvensis associated proteobacterium Delta 3]
MEKITSKRDVGLGILLTWCVYIVFALSTDWKDYGLIAKPEGYLRWTLARLSTVSIWLLLAGLLLWYRKQQVNWRSFIYSSIVTAIIAFILSGSLVSKGVNHAVITGTILFYAVVSGFLCVTIRKPKIAVFLGMLLFAAQFVLNAFAHIISGVFRFH